MDKNNLKDAYDIGENMAVFSGEGRIEAGRTLKANRMLNREGKETVR